MVISICNDKTCIYICWNTICSDLGESVWGLENSQKYIPIYETYIYNIMKRICSINPGFRVSRSSGCKWILNQTMWNKNSPYGIVGVSKWAIYLTLLVDGIPMWKACEGFDTNVDLFSIYRFTKWHLLRQKLDWSVLTQRV